MIDSTTLKAYLPQRMFLIQGNEEHYDVLTTSVHHQLIHSLSVPRFTVEHATTIVSFATEGDGTERTFVVYFSVFSPDAAQILLKSLEEPDPHTTIIFITPYPYVVPLTIRSRLTLIQTTRALIAPMNLSRAQALEYVKKELSSEGEDDAATRRAKALTLLDMLEQHCKGDAKKSNTIYESKHMLFRANMPTKFVMEYVVSSVL